MNTSFSEAEITGERHGTGVSLQAKPPQEDAPAILLVDDQPENLVALEAILDGMGHKLLQASSGREALRHLLHKDVALVLLDVRMPTMDGFETARLIRERKRSRTTPIIFLTAATTSDEMVSEGYSAGGVDYIVKPFVPEILKAKIEVFLNLATVRRNLEHEVERRRAAEKELENAAANLRSRAAELEVANQELEAFAYSASHDLRTPLRHIIGFVHLLQEEAEAKEDLTHFLDKIAQSTVKMNGLLDDLIAFGKVSREQMSTASVDLEALLEEVIKGLEPEIRNRHIIWRRSRLPVVIGDPAMLRQVLVNILTNALKYTIHSDPAEIEIGHRIEADEAIFFIRDNGAGFDMQFADKLFKVFQRLHREAEFAGTGIGLANVHRIVQRHGGRVWGEGKVGRGATFHVALRLAGAAH